MIRVLIFITVAFSLNTSAATINLVNPADYSHSVISLNLYESGCAGISIHPVPRTVIPKIKSLGGASCSMQILFPKIPNSPFFSLTVKTHIQASAGQSCEVGLVDQETKNVKKFILSCDPI